MTQDAPTPEDQHFHRTLKGITSALELKGFAEGWEKYRQSLTTEQKQAIARRRAEISR